MNLLVRAADCCGEFVATECSDRTAALALRDELQAKYPRAVVDVIDLDRVDVDCNGIIDDD